jgi:hypothetical protein
MRLHVPLELLPEDRHARHGKLRDYFCDKDATARRDSDGWKLELAWPAEVERHVDLRILQHLTGWGNIGLADMAAAQRRSGRVLTSLYDTWSLLSWSEWVARANPPADEQITILHIDDHRDIMSPRVGIERDTMVDLITGEFFDVRDPVSVRAACESGAVGMGSFLTPFLFSFSKCDVRQLCQPPKTVCTTDWKYRGATIKDDLLSPGADRPAIEMGSATGVGPGRYRATNNLQDWLADIKPGPVLLHVDMDYFNNRYDGDGDWTDRVRAHDPSKDQVLKHIDEVTKALRDAGLVEKIADAAVAFSPGFFPAELWQPAEERLMAGMRGLYG